MSDNQDPRNTQAQRPRQAVTDTLRTAERLKDANIGYAQATAIAVAIEDAAQVLGGIVHADSVKLESRLEKKFTSLEKKFDEFKTWMLTFASIALLILGGPNIARTGKIIFSSEQPVAQEQTVAPPQSPPAAADAYPVTPSPEDAPPAQEHTAPAVAPPGAAPSSAPAPDRTDLSSGEIAGSDKASPDPSADSSAQTKDSPKPGSATSSP